MKRKPTLLDQYRFAGCRPQAHLKGVFGDPAARVIRLVRTQKKVAAANAEASTAVSTTSACAGSETSLAETLGSIWRWRCAG